MRYTAATNAPVVRASKPVAIDVAFHQLDHSSPAELPAGTRAVMTAPSVAPRQNGVSTDPMPNSHPAICLARTRAASLRIAKLAARSTMPAAATASGMNSVDMMEANAGPNAVQHTTSRKISQTWLASHTGVTA